MTSKMKGLMEVSEELKSKLYDLERWEGMTQDTTQSLELRLQRIEEMAEQTANQLTVIHRSVRMNTNEQDFQYTPIQTCTRSGVPSAPELGFG